MNPREKGFLLLTSHLGDSRRKPLTMAQLRTLAQRMETMKPPEEDRELVLSDFLSLGYDSMTSHRILMLLSQEDLLMHYLKQGVHSDCVPVTRVSDDYPRLLRYRLRAESPGCLWAKGDVSLLNTPAISLVGSRDLEPENRCFAEEVGRQAARQGLTLVSGNARGADRAAQNACLEAGGRVISIVADELEKQLLQEGILYLSEDGYCEPFSAQRAISRNRCIHALGRITFVAQAALGKGGTWDGTVKNLRHGWSSVACFRDGSAASLELEHRGAWLVDPEDLLDFGCLPEQTENFLDR